MRKEMLDDDMNQVAAGQNLMNGAYYTVTGTQNYLALRSECEYNEENEIGRLNNGDRVQIIASGNNGYVMVDPGFGPGIVGFVNEKYLK